MAVSLGRRHLGMLRRGYKLEHNDASSKCFYKNFKKREKNDDRQSPSGIRECYSENEFKQVNCLSINFKAELFS